MSYRPVPWKRNLRLIPESVRNKLDSIESDEVVATAVIAVPDADYRAGKYAHFLRDEDGPSTTRIPDPEMGRYSRQNVQGWIRRDLPKIPRTYCVEAPNWGDWSKGSHDMCQTRYVYQRLMKQLSITISRLDSRPSPGGVLHLMRVSVDEVLGRNAEDFELNLLYNLNLLQENFGATGVGQPGETGAAAETVMVGWELLPIGTGEQRNIDAIAGNLDPQVRARIAERYAFFAEMNPRTLISGTSGFRRYFGFMFTDDLVVLENMDYGNAIYIMGDDWQVLSTLSRMELLSGGVARRFIRIEHRGDWMAKAAAIIRRQLSGGNVWRP